MPIPDRPKLYHIVHIDRLPSIIADGNLWCDRITSQRGISGTVIGMNSIKARRLVSELQSHPGLCVGDCVPFYFCPRSVMLYVIHKANHPGLAYRGGQAPIVHLEADLYQTVEWANRNNRRWAFTLSNAGSSYFEDRSDLAHLADVDWDAVLSRDWPQHRERKQAEFLVEGQFPWELVSRIGVFSRYAYNDVYRITRASEYQPRIEIQRNWYY